MKITNLKNLEGQTFGLWKVSSFYETDGKHTFWWCKCRCGIIKKVGAWALRTGNSRSCVSCGAREGIKYTPKSGIFWRNGKPIRTVHPTGYIKFWYNGKSVCGHIVAWNLIHGSIPKGMQIDHINRIKTDNRIENLRLVTVQENAFNREGFKNASSIYKGVTFKPRGKWEAASEIGGKYKYLGSYDTEIEAAKAFNAYVKSLNLPTAYLNPVEE